MKPFTRLPAAAAGIATAGIAALVLTGTPGNAMMLRTGTPAVGMTTVSSSAVSTGSSTARTGAASQSTQASLSQLMTAWDNSPGYADLNAVEAALSDNDGSALARDTTLAAAHPQPVDTSDYIAMMNAYHSVGVALVRGDKKAAKADMVPATDIAWVVVQNTFAAVNRLPVNG